ncbi:MAG: energy transducer TonB [Zoogloea sp.]|nr:energy transducer TonB [Zoogloea sp.]
MASNRAGGPAGSSGAAGAVAYSPPGLGASYLHNPKPAYPLLARRRGLEGVVRLDVRVSAEGIPIAVKVRESSGHESLDEAALTAVWHWRFSPARRGGEAVEGAVVVPVRFNLEGETAG